jgi:hypothetical protein
MGSGVVASRPEVVTFVTVSVERWYMLFRKNQSNIKGDNGPHLDLSDGPDPDGSSF